jgi:hypothetical protein
MKPVVPVFAVLASLLAFAAPAGAAAGESVVQADLNGDGQLDQVVGKPVPGDPNRQLLVATVGHTNYVADEPVDPDWGIRPMRVVDVNGDGRQEVLVQEVVGMRTDAFSVWGLHDGFRPVTSPDQNRLLLWEGGAFGDTISRYGCQGSGGGRQLVTVFAELVDEASGTYRGQRTVYEVDAGTAEQVSSTPVSGTRDSVATLADPGACA